MRLAKVAKQRIHYLTRRQVLLDRFERLNPLRDDLHCDLVGCACRLVPFVWVSHRQHLLYFEIPKTASSSIKDMLGLKVSLRMQIHGLARQFACLPQGRRVSLRSRLVLGREGRRMLNEEMDRVAEGVREVDIDSPFGFRALFMKPDEAVKKFPNYTTVGVVRNPVERIISCWSMFCSSNNPFREQQIASLFGKPAKSITLNEFIMGLKSNPNHHWESMITYMPKDGVKELFYLETITADLKRLSGLLGQNIELPHRNPSRRTVAKLSSEAIGQLNAYCACDQETFGYEAYRGKDE